MPYGNRFYHPIWEACERHGLVVGIHPGNEGAGMAGPPTGVGYPTYYIETRMARPQMAMAHARLLHRRGRLREVPAPEGAVRRVRPVLGGRPDVAHGRRLEVAARPDALGQAAAERVLPSSTSGSARQPMLEPENDEQFFMMLDAMHAERDARLLAPTGRTGTGTTRPRPSRSCPERLHRRVFAENARELFGL